MAIAIVAVVIRPHGCGNGQNAVMIHEQAIASTVCQMLNRVLRTGSARFHHFGITKSTPK